MPGSICPISGWDRSAPEICRRKLESNSGERRAAHRHPVIARRQSFGSGTRLASTPSIAPVCNSQLYSWNSVMSGRQE